MLWKDCLVTQSCPILCNPMDCSPPGSSVHGILQARILEWIVIPFSRGSSQPKDQTWVFCTAGGFFTTELSGKPCALDFIRFLFLSSSLPPSIIIFCLYLVNSSNNFHVFHLYMFLLWSNTCNPKFTILTISKCAVQGH